MSDIYECGNCKFRDNAADSHPCNICTCATHDAQDIMWKPEVIVLDEQKEYTGSSVSYYSVKIDFPTSGGDPYIAECNDIIEALGMNFAEGNAFKAIWRSCAARTLGKSKDGYKDGLYDAEKVVFFGKRMIHQWGKK